MTRELTLRKPPKIHWQAAFSAFHPADMIADGYTV